MMQYPFPGGLIAVLIPCCTGLFKLPDKAERLKKKMVVVSHYLFHVLCVELYFWEVGSDGGSCGMKLKY